MSSTPPPKLKSGLVAISAAAAIFSWGFVIVKAVDVPPPSLAMWRLLIGATSLTAAVIVFRVPWPRERVPMLIAGLAFGGHQLLYMSATKLTSIAIVALFGAAQPLVVSLIAHRAVGDAFSIKTVGWSVLALAGIGLVVMASYDSHHHSWLGDGLAVLNLAVFTTYFLASKRARLGGAPTLSLTAGCQWIALLVVLPVAAFQGITLPALAPFGLIAVLAIGPGNGHLLVNWAHYRVPAALSSLVLTAVPLLAALWAHLALGEPFTARHVAGLAVVAVAIEGGRRGLIKAMPPTSESPS